jgi:hypothetical protein
VLTLKTLIFERLKLQKPLILSHKIHAKNYSVIYIHLLSSSCCLFLTLHIKKIRKSQSQYESILSDRILRNEQSIHASKTIKICPFFLSREVFSQNLENRTVLCLFLQCEKNCSIETFLCKLKQVSGIFQSFISTIKNDLKFYGFC